MFKRSIAMVAVSSLFFFACDDREESEDPSGAGGEASTGSGGGLSTTSGGGPGSSQTDFVDLPGKIRFANFVSDGIAGVDLDLYWGTTMSNSEFVDTLDYATATEYLVPRHVDHPVLDADQARYFIVVQGDVSSDPTTFLVQADPRFAADTVITVALAAKSGTVSSGDLIIQRTDIFESKLSTPPSGMSHVFGWSNAFDQIADGDFVLVGSADLCSPEQGSAPGVNLGVPYLIPAGTSSLSLFDANTEPPCASGSASVDSTLVDGHSYVLIGEAETYAVDDRKAVLFELGTE